MPDEERCPEDLHIPVHVEEISVSRREIEKANVQVALVTETREQLIDEELTHVRVEIERVPIDRTIEAMWYRQPRCTFSSLFVTVILPAPQRSEVRGSR